jgi:hypothetical protein
MLKINTEENKVVEDYFKQVDNKINGSPILNKYMSFNCETIKFKTEVQYNLSFKTIFPNIFFKYVAIYIFLISVITYFFTNSVFILVLLNFFGLILLIPILFQQDFFLFYLIKKVLRKKGYSGGIKWV